MTPREAHSLLDDALCVLPRLARQGTVDYDTARTGALLAALAAWRRWDGRGDRTAYVRRYARLGAIEALRRVHGRKSGRHYDRRRLRTLPLDAAPEPATAPDPGDRIDARRLLRRISAQERRAVAARYRGDTQRETAARLGVSEARVSQILSRLPQRLAAYAAAVLLFAVLLFAVLPVLPAAAQTVTTDVCTLTATPSAVRYRMAHLDTTVSRDLLASLPRAGRYQHVDDDLALCLDAATYGGAKVLAFSTAASSEYMEVVAQAVRRQEAFRQAAVRAETEAAALRRELEAARAENVTLQAEADALNGLIERIAERVAVYLERTTD